ncbi:hypothetical protein N7462_004408 [Penicillium macrosclerotiorum]|uniref:uncharacterized protein n=1 Tax=Penicillium macrosclerotiorum TaxID=303699 RepID=UPI002547A612|nr:uncharacterized protein N7462_004408 [Penicillium macrosclerotiorum]KAJ5690016.1 hypothetical protein N7462_004408 [Penicillium macrosclerotiorum]
MQGSFLSTPCTQGHSRYVWGLQSSDQDFVIWEDPMADNGGFPFVMTPRLYSETEEDKENTYATVSDYESPTDSEHPARVDWTRIQTASRDVFGLPRDPSFGPELADLSMTPARVGNSVPTVTETSIRPAIRVMERDEDDPEDWDDSLSTAQIRELQELSDIYHRGAESRRQHDRHFPMRDENVQGQANIFLEVRRVTQFQRHENRQSPFAMDEDD